MYIHVNNIIYHTTQWVFVLLCLRSTHYDVCGTGAHTHNIDALQHYFENVGV